MSEKENKNITFRMRITEEEDRILEILSKKCLMDKSKLARNILFGYIYDERMLKRLKEIPILENYAQILDQLGAKEYIFDNEVENILETLKIGKYKN